MPGKLVYQLIGASLNLLSLVSRKTAADKAFRLFFTPYSGKPFREVPALFKRAFPLILRTGGLAIRGFEWLPDAPILPGRTILLCHGFDSFSYRYEPYVVRLIEKGFRVIAFDAPGHGTSEGEHVTAVVYAQAILDICQAFGPVDAIVAHSLACLATGLAAEEGHALFPSELVLIAPFIETSRALDDFFAKIPLNKKLRRDFRDRITSVAGHPPEWYSLSRIAPSLPQHILWIHDTDDTICPYSDTAALQAQKPPHIEFRTTSGLGHNRIYKEPFVQEEVLRYLIGRLG